MVCTIFNQTYLNIVILNSPKCEKGGRVIRRPNLEFWHAIRMRPIGKPTLSTRIRHYRLIHFDG